MIYGLQAASIERRSSSDSPESTLYLDEREPWQKAVCLQVMFNLPARAARHNVAVKPCTSVMGRLAKEARSIVRELRTLAALPQARLEPVPLDAPASTWEEGSRLVVGPAALRPPGAPWRRMRNGIAVA